MNNTEQVIIDLYNKYKENKDNEEKVTMTPEEIVRITEFTLTLRNDYLAIRQALEKEIDYSRLLKMENNNLRGGK